MTFSICCWNQQKDKCEWLMEQKYIQFVQLKLLVKDQNNFFPAMWYLESFPSSASCRIYVAQREVGDASWALHLNTFCPLCLEPSVVGQLLFGVEQCEGLLRSPNCRIACQGSGSPVTLIFSLTEPIWQPQSETRQWEGGHALSSCFTPIRNRVHSPGKGHCCISQGQAAQTQGHEVTQVPGWWRRWAHRSGWGWCWHQVPCFIL